MAVIFTEGFDKYGPPGIANDPLSRLLVQGEWTTVNYSNGWIAIVDGLSDTGQALQLGNNVSYTSGISKTLASRYTRLIGGFRFLGSLVNISGMTLSDGSHDQCAISLDTVGTISLRTGSLTSATIVATSISSVSAYSINYLEFDITISTNGAYHIWLNSLSILNGVGNTQGGSSANLANVVSFTSSPSWPYTSLFTFDDFYLFDSTGVSRNAVLLTNPRIETQFPVSDATTHQFINNASILGFAYTATTNIHAPGANTLFLRRYVAEVNATLNSVSCVPQTTASVHFKAVAYADNAGIPTTLLASGAEVYGIWTGTTLTSNLFTPQSLIGGTPYWIGFMTDSSGAIAQQDTTIQGVRATAIYTDAAPASLGPMTTGFPSWQIWGNCTGATVNWASLNNNPAAGILSYVSSATVGAQDFYTFSPLSSTPTHIYAVGVKGNVSRTDTGVRTVDMVLQSGTAISLGNNSNITPPTSFSWVDSYFEVDPNTGQEWLPAALNAAIAGPKVES